MAFPSRSEAINAVSVGGFELLTFVKRGPLWDSGSTPEGQLRGGFFFGAPGVSIDSSRIFSFFVSSENLLSSWKSDFCDSH